MVQHDVIPIVADMHTHTLSSIHAFSSIGEMAQAAAIKGLWGLGIAEHGPAITGHTDYYFFYNTEVWPDEIHGVQLFRCCEADILDTAGTLDIENRILERLDFVLAGLHYGPYLLPQDTNKAWTTRAVLNAMENPNVDCISHPCNPKYPMDYDAFVRKAAKNNILVEVNISSLCNTMRTGSEENLRTLLRLAKKYDAEIIINSDAHIACAVGMFDPGLKLFKEEGIPAEQIVNSSKTRLVSFLQKKGKLRFQHRQPQDYL